MKKSILIIEDDILTAELYAAFLADLPVEITIARDGTEGIEKMEQHIYDLVLLDLEMPVMNGFEFLVVAAARHPTLPPILVCSGLSHKEVIADALVAGASDYLIKPMTKTQMVQTVCLFMKMPTDPQTGKVNSLTEVNTEMVLTKKSGIVSVTTPQGVGQVIYQFGKLKQISYNGKSGLEALEQLKNATVIKITVSN
jgi:CheY-like chemotaxis protein